MIRSDTKLAIPLKSNPPIPIAFVVATFQFGGLERCVARIVNHLDRSRFRPVVISLSTIGAADEWITADDVPTIALDKRPGNDPRVVWRLARTLSRENVRLVQSHNWGTLLETSAARILSRVSCHVHAEHGIELEAMQIATMRSRLRSAVTRATLESTSQPIAVADNIRQRIEKSCGFKADRIQIVRNGVDIEPCADGFQRQALRDSIGIGSSATMVASMGRLAGVKDFGTAIDALAELAQRGSDVHLVLIGDGPEKERLLKYAREKQVEDRFHAVGQQSNISEWLAATDIYINSSVSEGMNLAIIEAMAAGRASVVTDVGGNSLLVDGTSPCGLVVPSEAPVAMADAIEKIVRHPDLRANYENCASQRFEEEYRTEVMVRRYEELYEELLRKKNLV